jgi:hypothetical protein
LGDKHKTLEQPGIYWLMRTCLFNFCQLIKVVEYIATMKGGIFFLKLE